MIEKCPANPILTAQREWEADGVDVFHGTVLYDEAEHIFKMWYRALAPGASFVCHAISRDGIDWQRPELGIVAFNGSTANNIVIAGGFCDGATIVNPTVFRNRDGYMMLAWDCPGTKRDLEWGAYVWRSDDGLRWHRGERPVWITPLDAAEGFNDDVISVARDPHRGSYVAFRRVMPWESLVYRGPQDAIPSKPPPIQRIIAAARSDDLMRWRDMHVILQPDADDPPGTEFYGMVGFVLDGRWHGLLEIFNNRTQWVDVQLVTSADGRRWQRSASRRSILPRGAPGTYDTGMIFPASAPFVKNDRLWVYYGAWDGDHAGTCRPSIAMASISIEDLRP